MKFVKRTNIVLFGVVLIFLLSGCTEQYVLLDPAGPVARIEYENMLLTIFLSALVVVPTLGIMAYVIYRYRDYPGNSAPYKPNWKDSKILEVIWWGIPIIIVAVLGYSTIRDTFALPNPPSKQKPITIQVVSLDWKWLFIYPEEKMATVNYVEIPEKVPVQFVLTSDAPMNSFWVPQLGGQMYTMPGMEMYIWLQADKPGVYEGKGANFTGKGFAHMTFQVVAKSHSEYKAWIQKVKASSPPLTHDKYKELAKKSVMKPQFYSSVPSTLYQDIVNKNGGIYWKQKHQHHQVSHP